MKHYNLELERSKSAALFLVVDPITDEEMYQLRLLEDGIVTEILIFPEQDAAKRWAQLWVAEEDYDNMH